MNNTTVTAAAISRLATAMVAADGITCPDCGGILEVHTDGMVGTLVAPTFIVVGQSEPTYRMEPRPFVACCTCEFCMEIRL